MKTITDQLNELPPLVRERAFKYKKDFWDNERGIPSVKLALAVGFKWDETDEGQGYWSEVYVLVS
jgi:hypothetical protein